jgi:hypothetical protein
MVTVEAPFICFSVSMPESLRPSFTSPLELRLS